MLAVTIPSFWLADFVMGFWFIYFQYYWLPQLRVRHFMAYAWGLAAAYATADTAVLVFTHHALLTSLPALILVGVECLTLVRRYRRYLPAFISMTILAYLLIEFIDTVSLTLTMLLTNVAFMTTLPGGVVTLTFDSVFFALTLLATLSTQAPIENLIQSMLGRNAEYFFLGLMSVMMLVFSLFEYALQALNWSVGYLIFLMGISGVLMLGVTLCTYILVQSHLQTEHTHAQLQVQRFHDQYETELHRQVASVRKFQHDYQNMLLGLGGYLADHDYAGFQQLYIDIRSRWATSNAADLTINDLENIPKIGVRYEVYHQYLEARRLGVDMYVKTPEPLTLTMEALRQLARIVTRTFPIVLPYVAQLRPAMVTLELLDAQYAVHFRLTFPVGDDARIVAAHQLTSAQGDLDFSQVTRHLTLDTSTMLQAKRHWGQLEIILPKNGQN